MNHHRDGYESITWKQGLEGYFRDPEFDQNTVQDSGKCKISWRETGFDSYPGSGIHRNLGRGMWDFIPSLSGMGSHDDSNSRSRGKWDLTRRAVSYVSYQLSKIY